MNWKVEKNIIVWENFTGWYGGDKYYAPKNSYFDAYNIDTTLFKARVSWRNQLYLTPSTGQNVECMYANENNEIISVLNNREVYRDATYRQTLPTGLYTRLASMFVWGTQFLYAFQDSGISGTQKIQKMQTSGAYVSEITYSSTGIYTLLSPTNWLVILEEKDRIIFSNFNNLFVIDNTETVTLVHSFPASENIVGITNFQWQYAVYTNTLWKNSTKYRWNGIGGDSIQIQRQITLEGYSLLSVINDWPYDYGMMNNELYRFSWVQFQEVTAKIGGALLKNIGGWIYHTWTGRENKGALNRFGAEPWFSERLHSYTYVVNGTSDTITSTQDKIVYDNFGNVYFAVYDKIYKVAVTWASVTPTAHIISNQFVWNDIREEKTLELVFLKYSNTDINNKIKLEVKLNDTGSWVQIYEWYNGEQDDDKYGIRIVANKFTNTIGRFNEIAFRVSFVTDGTTRPTFMGLRAFYNNDVWN